MEAPPDPHQPVSLPEKRLSLRGYLVEKDQVAKVLQRLDDAVKVQGKSDIAALIRPQDADPADWERQKADLLNRAFRVTTTVIGSDGSSLYVPHVKDVFDQNTPEVVAGVFATSRTSYREVFDHAPVRQFEMQLDFTKPPLLDDRNMASSPTPNNSYLAIKGDSAGWIGSVEHAALEPLLPYKNGRSWMHAAFVYDLGLMLIALPSAFYVTYKISEHFSAQIHSLHDIVQAALYVYLFLLVIWGYRLLFGYTKWAFPVTELIDGRSASFKHRRAWYAIIGSLLLAAGYDLVKSLAT